MILQATYAVVQKIMVVRIVLKELGFVSLTTRVRTKDDVFSIKILQTILVNAKVVSKEEIALTISMSVPDIPLYVIPLTGKQLALTRKGHTNVNALQNFKVSIVHRMSMNVKTQSFVKTDLECAQTFFPLFLSHYMLCVLVIQDGLVRHFCENNNTSVFIDFCSVFIRFHEFLFIASLKHRFAISS